MTKKWKSRSAVLEHQGQWRSTEEWGLLFSRGGGRRWRLILLNGGIEDFVDLLKRIVKDLVF
jgi:hypothetical protein